MLFLEKLFKMTCRDTSPLISERMDHALPFSKRWRVAAHLTLCKACRYYETQLWLLRRLVKKSDETREETNRQTALSAAAKRKLKEIINNFR